MTTESEIKLARYSETVKEVDELGRLIGVRRLKPSEQTKVAGFTAELFGYDEMMNEKGVKVQIPHRMPLILAASVCYISDDRGEVHVPFPRNRGELDAIYDRLDTEGLVAAGRAWNKLNPPKDKDEFDEINQIKDDTKNLSGTPSSGSSLGS
jgi:hypothetical protein